MKLWQKVASQFGKPTGFLGSVAGFIMSHRESNIERNKWGVELLNLQPDDNVLEIGFGPGIAIKMMSDIITQGTIFGIDHSEKMLSSAQKRNSDAIKSGRVTLICSSISSLPEINIKFGKVLDINSFQFWENPVDDLIKLKKHMIDGGTIALVHQPRKPGATDADATDAGNNFSDLLQQAGFENIKIHKKIMKPVSTVCVTARVCFV